MNSKEIIKSINSIYDKFRIMPNLRLHMLRTAATSELICDNWKGPKINKFDIIAVGLIHDLGNMVKMDLESENGLKLIGEELKNLDYWKKVKQEIILKYGTDDHRVTEIMIDELNVSNKVKFLLKEHIFVKNELTLNSDDWELKICAYADQRIGPFGVLNLKDRFDEVKKRYADRPNQSVHNKKFDIFVECSFKIEGQVLKNVSLSSDEINDESIKSYLTKYLNIN